MWIVIVIVITQITPQDTNGDNEEEPEELTCYVVRELPKDELEKIDRYIKRIRAKSSKDKSVILGNITPSTDTSPSSKRKK